MSPVSTTGLPVPLDSTVLASALYDVNGSALRLEFRSGAVYLYFNVSASVYEGLLTAESKGSFFSRHIRPVFNSVRQN